ncbi:MAG: response regulator, partial [Asticcacaulis sp.]|nr:response regulator [Asticcacaulis sp.]
MSVVRAEASYAPGRRGAPAKILLVDDRPENLLATEALLRPLGAQIVTAESGEAALGHVLEHTFAMVLLDVQMPGMDGFETAQLMQTRPSMQGVPIVFVTAISKEDHFATRAAGLGAADYIFKPINPDILKSKVKVYLDLYRQREQILSLNATLRQSNEELERFAYVCSHDMQEPVRMMNTYAAFLAEDAAGRLEPGTLRYVQYIRDNAVRMQKMIRDILTFSRVGREELQVETVDSQKVLDEVLHEVRDIVEA